jgi:hypothetical protein
LYSCFFFIDVSSLPIFRNVFKTTEGAAGTVWQGNALLAHGAQASPGDCTGRLRLTGANLGCVEYRAALGSSPRAIFEFAPRVYLSSLPIFRNAFKTTEGAAGTGWQATP